MEWLPWLCILVITGGTGAYLIVDTRRHLKYMADLDAAWRRDMAAERDRHAKDREGLMNRIQRPETLGQAPADRKPRQPWSDQREADIARKQEEANGRPLR